MADASSREHEKYFSNKYSLVIIVLLFSVAGILLTFFANGTCDDGDSIMHYQFARWAVIHHQLFFDHWAKPLYVLIACPFAQFGMTGMKLFNLFISVVTICITYQIAGYLDIQRKALVTLFMALSPGLMVLSLSGLTEPLFACILAGCVLLYFRNNTVASILLISFLPFVRSEGLMMCGLFGLILLLEKKWKFMPLLAVGHVVYSLAGYTVYGNLLWVFTRIPYARLDSIYGHGDWSHFFIYTPNITGWPLYVLLIIGCLVAIFRLVKTWRDKSNWRRWILIEGSFLTMFVGHVIFWRFGIFNSLGLLRVLLGVLPMMAIVELEGLSFVLQAIKQPMQRNIAFGLTLIAVVVFPFLNFESSWNYRRDFCLTVSQLSNKAATDYLKSNLPVSLRTQYYYDANYVSILMSIDFFDTTISRRVWEIYDHPPKDTAYILWDNYYAAFESKTRYEVPANNPRFELVKKFTLYDTWNFEKTTVLFKARSEEPNNQPHAGTVN